MTKLIAMCFAMCLMAGCMSSDSDATQTLRNSGYSNIKTTGLNPLSCSEDDFTRTGFVATNPSGQRVAGTVCCGMIFKGCTIRF